MLFRGVGEACLGMRELKAPPVKLLGVELERKAASESLHARSQPSACAPSSTLARTPARIGLHASAVHAECSAPRWFLLLVRPCPVRPRLHGSISCTSLVSRRNLSHDIGRFISADSLAMSLPVLPAQLSLNCYSSDEDEELVRNASASDTAIMRSQMRRHHYRRNYQTQEGPAMRPYVVRRTFFHFRLLIVGLYREFLDRPDVVVLLHEAASDLFSACLEAERPCISALLDTLFAPSKVRATLLESRSITEFFSRWPGDRAHDELEQATREFTEMFDAWDDLQSSGDSASRHSSSTSHSISERSEAATPLRSETIRRMSKLIGRPSLARSSTRPRSLSSTLLTPPSCAPSLALPSPPDHQRTPLKRSKSTLTNMSMRVVRKAVSRASLMFNHDPLASADSSASTYTPPSATTVSQDSGITSASDLARLSSSSSLLQSETTLAPKNAKPESDVVFADELISALTRVCLTSEGSAQQNAKHDLCQVEISHTNNCADAHSTARCTMLLPPLLPAYAVF
ncbi:hypothetical protein THASP1DRAFT_32345 [Thamnocephalis sphaerospora]|uniref:Uncharacterized protein n=1 Tax=Thamnocephalis sphaerospora TaxID=78915 RepID=A0A4P9XKM3_9FUNG|nr:hypothetical protein THASP1DRAFT_32345 [Thamnocephalis sphaerospora]|eukprot:RKP05820.1 hypothetical protein THASP1DRAFT_32345 [Thamnocephalis sphaerospora]